MWGIFKQFGPVVALQGVDFDVRSGEVHALVGENGAGKTTLMRILYGMEQADAGCIELDGRPVAIPNPEVAQRLGIGMVHQRFKLIPTLSVVENVVLGREPGRWGLIDRRRARQEVAAIAREHGMEVDLDARVGSLPVGVQQRVEILKLLFRRADVLVFDEPTSVLTPQETRALFQTIRNLKAQGKAVVYISHKLWEIMEIADRITVLRRGVRQGTVERSEASSALLTRLMFGEELPTSNGGRWEESDGREALPELARHGSRGAAEMRLLWLHDVTAADDRGVRVLNGITLELRAGEILGIAGVEGNGQRELAEVIAGTRPVIAGRIVLAGHDVTAWPPRWRREAGLAYIPEDRDAEGVGPDLSVADNLIAVGYYRRPLSRYGVLSGRAISSFCRERIQRFGVRAAGLAAAARTLSGGNLQKLVVAREAGESPRVLVAAHPTRGVDMGAIRSIHRTLLELRESGTGILLISGDLDEILALSDRVATIYRGRITGVLARDEADRERVGALMLGAEERAS